MGKDMTACRLLERMAACCYLIKIRCIVLGWNPLELGASSYMQVRVNQYSNCGRNELYCKTQHFSVLIPAS